MLDFSAILSAFSRVQENAGCAGVDGTTIQKFECRLTRSLTELSREVTDKSYLPFPVLRILVDKGNGEGRDQSLDE